MTNILRLIKPSEVSSLTPDETSEIAKKVDIELNLTLLKVIKIGGIANFLSVILIAFILSHRTPWPLLISWTLVLFVLNTINFIYPFYCEHYNTTSQKMASRRKFHYCIIALLCITWGSMSLLFSAYDPDYHLYTTIFLLAILLGFSFGAIPDFNASVISTSFLLIPYIAYHIFSGVRSILLGQGDPHLNLGFAACIFILGIFMTGVCYIGNRLIKKSFQLTFTNITLNKKLENINKFLEDRVKERTIELEKSLQLVKYQATHDLLTNLPNHLYLLENLEQAITLADKKNSMVYILFFALNEMDKINDGLGHQASSLTIQTITERLQKALKKTPKSKLFITRYTITLSRRDEFVILLESNFDSKEIEKIAEVFFHTLEEPVHIEQQALKLTGSIGASVYPKDGKDVKTLLMNADAAMVRAKQWGGNKLIHYKSEINADISKQLELESYLHDALKNDEFRLYYQPFIDLNTGKICGAEALIRWKNPTLGFISPLAFIFLAESNGMIIPLGEWVFGQACSQTKVWHERGFTSLKMAINLSAKQLQQENIVAMVKQTLKKINLTPEYIELELTETEAFKEEAIPVLKQLKAIGLNLSIDDFGTGYSGLKNLKLFTIDKLKIDIAFVRDIDKNSESRAIVSNIIGLAKKMGISVLAEGVETREQLISLKKLGCNMIQGYYFSPPIPADDFTELLISNQALAFDILPEDRDQG
jgi:diguanylate cyclase (GGDEF)-like protein